jgi:FkbM family methyltransferase
MNTALRIYSILISIISDGINTLSFIPTWAFIPKGIYINALEQLKLSKLSYKNDMALIETYDKLCFLGPSNEKDYLCGKIGLSRANEHAALIHNLVTRYITEFSSYPFWNIRTRNLRAGDTFVDIGAFRGYVSCKAACLVGEHGHVIAVEPIQENIRYVEAHKEINNFTQIKIIPSAISIKQSEHIEFYRSKNQQNSEKPDHLSRDTQKLSVQNFSTQKLSDIILANKPKRVIMSITTNGTEIELMKSFFDCLKKNVPYLEITIPIIYTKKAYKESVEKITTRDSIIYLNYPWLTIISYNQLETQ